MQTSALQRSPINKLIFFFSNVLVQNYSVNTSFLYLQIGMYLFLPF